LYYNISTVFVKTLYVVILLYTASSSATAQNLVPNFSFEDISQCPSDFDQISNASPWFAARKNDIGSTDLFNVCGSRELHSPNNFNGIQEPKYGNSYAGLYALSHPAFFLQNGTPLDTAIREYLETPLLEKLIAGKKYCLTFYVSLADESTGGIKEVSGLISSGPVYQDDYPVEVPSPYLPNTFSYIPMTPQVTSVDFLTDTENWTAVSGMFTAKGNEDYLTIGNFESTKHTSYMPVQENDFHVAYYYVDNVTLVDADRPCEHRPAALPHDTTLCSGQNLTINLATDGTFEYLWRDGSTATTYTISSPGLYWLDMFSCGCHARDSIVVSGGSYQNPFPNDTTLCNGTALTLTVDGVDHSFLWSTGATGSSIVVDATGLYSVDITGVGCHELDSVMVHFYDCIDFLPNVITPNNDGKNDFFVVNGINKDKWTFEVLNRWEQSVYKNYDYDNSWGGEGLSAGIYYFHLVNQSNKKSYHGWVEVVSGDK
jgi:hypothetical protein